MPWGLYEDFEFMRIRLFMNNFRRSRVQRSNIAVVVMAMTIVAGMTIAAMVMAIALATIWFGKPLMRILGRHPHTIDISGNRCVDRTFEINPRLPRRHKFELRVIAGGKGGRSDAA